MVSLTITTCMPNGVRSNTLLVKSPMVKNPKQTKCLLHAYFVSTVHGNTRDYMLQCTPHHLHISVGEKNVWQY